MITNSNTKLEYSKGYDIERAKIGSNHYIVPSRSAADCDSSPVTFDSHGDPYNPRSMPNWRKWSIVSIICNGTLCVTCASSIYTTTYSQMNSEFLTSPMVATIGLASFVLGIGLGPLITGPLSEFYGRRPVYLLSWLLFTIWNIPSAVGQNIETLIITRFFAGSAGGTFLSVAGGSISDLFAANSIQTPMVFASAAPFIGPSLGPSIGGFFNYYTSWRWSYYFILIWSTVTLLLVIFLTPETYHPICLLAKAQHLREKAGDNRYYAPAQRSPKSKAKIIGLSLLRPFQFLILEPMCTCLNIYSAMLLGILYLFFGAWPQIFQDTYGMNQWQCGLTFLGIVTGMSLAGAGILIKSTFQHTAEHKLATGGSSEPEEQLRVAIVGSILIPIGLFIFAWTARSDIHWVAPVLGGAVFGCGTLLVYTAIFTFLVAAYPQYAASALASNGVVRCSCAAAFPFFGVTMYEQLEPYVAGSILSSLTVVMMPFPWMFYRCGKSFRKRSRFASFT